MKTIQRLSVPIKILLFAVLKSIKIKDFNKKKHVQS